MRNMATGSASMSSFPLEQTSGGTMETQVDWIKAKHKHILDAQS